MLSYNVNIFFLVITIQTLIGLSVNLDVVICEDPKFANTRCATNRWCTYIRHSEDGRSSEDGPRESLCSKLGTQKTTRPPTEQPSNEPKTTPTAAPVSSRFRWTTDSPTTTTTTTSTVIPVVEDGCGLVPEKHSSQALPFYATVKLIGRPGRMR